MNIKKCILLITLIICIFSIKANEYLNWSINDFVERKDIKEILVYNADNELIKKRDYKKLSDNEVNVTFIDYKRNTKTLLLKFKFNENQVISIGYLEGEPNSINTRTYNSEGKVIFNHLERYEFDWYSDSDEKIKKVSTYSYEYSSDRRLNKVEVTGDGLEYIEYRYGDTGFLEEEIFYYTNGMKRVSKCEFEEKNNYTIYDPYYFFERYHRFTRRVKNEKCHRIVRDYLYWNEEDKDESYTNFMQIWKRDRLMEYYDQGKQYIIIYEGDNAKRRIKNSLLLNNKISGKYVEEKTNKSK